MQAKQDFFSLKKYLMYIYTVKSKCVIVKASKESPKFSNIKQGNPQNLQIVLVLPNQILMYFNAGKQSKPKQIQKVLFVSSQI